jgi:hypothetical protein
MEECKNYEKLYNDLKAECEQTKLDNDEICKEYELTIQMLTESVNNFQKEKDTLQETISSMEKEIKKYEKEKESLTNKNKDKIIDIQNLNKTNEKLKEEMKKILDEKNLTKSRIIALENDNDHYQKKIRQNDALIEDLTSQLESALEENITLQTEFELYKQQNEETLIRKEQEIKDIQNDITNKEKIIQRLNDRRASIRELKQKFQIPGDYVRQYQRKLTTALPEIYDGLKYHKEKDDDKLDKSAIIEENKLITPLNNSSTNCPLKFMEMYRKCNINNQSGKKNEIVKKKNNNNIEVNLAKKSTNNISSKTKNIKEEVISDAENSEKNEDIMEFDNDNDNDSTDLEKKFYDLVICDEKDFNIIPIQKLKNENKNEKNKKLADNLKIMLARIQKRKDVLINNQKKNNKKLEQLGLKIRY